MHQLKLILFFLLKNSNKFFNFSQTSMVWHFINQSNQLYSRLY
jgi:hypothetical protein